jgi:hypothetical protein
MKTGASVVGSLPGLPWHFLYFRPLPHGHGWFLPIFAMFKYEPAGHCAKIARRTELAYLTDSRRFGSKNRLSAPRKSCKGRGCRQGSDLCRRHSLCGQVEETADNEKHDVNFVLILALQVIHPLRLIEFRFDYAYIQHILFRCPSPRIASLRLKQPVSACCQAAF